MRPLIALGAVVLLLVASGLVLAAPGAHAGAASHYPPMTGSVSGPTTLGTGLNGTYVVTASGGPAEATNTTIVGVYTFNATLSGPNTTGAIVTPESGVLVNQTVSLRLAGPTDAGQTITLSVLVRSGYNGANVTENLTEAIDIASPYNLLATLNVAPGATIGPLDLTVTLDGSPVGTVHVPTLTGGTTWPVHFEYVALGLSPGWHTFAISLAQQHGLIVFAGGSESYTQDFYIPGPAPNYTWWYFAGAAVFLGTIFIWVTRVGARRRPKAKK
jgi:hypothetical protein